MKPLFTLSYCVFLLVKPIASVIQPEDLGNHVNVITSPDDFGCFSSKF